MRESARERDRDRESEKRRTRERAKDREKATATKGVITGSKNEFHTFQKGVGLKSEALKNKIN